MTKDKVKYDYDKDNDILYILLPTENGQSYGIHISDTIVIHRDLDSGIITGITIFDISKYLKDEGEKR